MPNYTSPADRRDTSPTSTQCFVAEVGGGVVHQGLVEGELVEITGYRWKRSDSSMQGVGTRE